MMMRVANAWIHRVDGKGMHNEQWCRAMQDAIAMMSYGIV
jgi:hypothetical protein